MYTKKKKKRKKKKKGTGTEGLKAAENIFLFLEKEMLRCVAALEETRGQGPRGHDRQEVPHSSIREP